MSRRARSAALHGRGAGGVASRDFARVGAPVASPHRALAPLLIGLLVAGLALASLRIDLIRVRYALAAAMRVEDDLREERRQLLAEVRTLRDPARLAERARALGFARPERVLELPAREPRP